MKEKHDLSTAELLTNNSEMYGIFIKSSFVNNPCESQNLENNDCNASPSFDVGDFISLLFGDIFKVRELLPSILLYLIDSWCMHLFSTLFGIAILLVPKIIGIDVYENTVIT